MYVIVAYVYCFLRALSSYVHVRSHITGEDLLCVQCYTALGLPAATLSPASWGEACPMSRPFCLCETDHGPCSVLL